MMRNIIKISPAGIVSALLIATPLIFLLFLGAANRSQMALQADEISTLATAFRNYYADNVISRIQSSGGIAKPSENFRQIHGGIPIPATLSIELGPLFDSVHRDGRISYEFKSDYPFAQRERPPLTPLEQEFLDKFRSDPTLDKQTKFTSKPLNTLSGGGEYTSVTPIRMKQSCVQCHNSHPDSPRRDWRVGDVRGIQKVTISGLRTEGFGNLGLMFLYVFLAALLALIALLDSRKKLKMSTTHAREITRRLTIEKRHRSEIEEVADRRKIFESTLEGSVVGIAIADMTKEDRPIVYVNKAFCDLTGYQKEECIGRNCRFLQGPDTDQKEIDRIRKALKSGKRYNGRIVNYRANGSKFVNSLVLIPILLDNEARPTYYISNQSCYTKNDLDS